MQLNQNQYMRIVQLIDSLEPGGAERIAVNLANGFSQRHDFSGLVVTRAEGGLRKTIKEEVDFFFAAKKSAVDMAALLRFVKYLKQNKIEIIHAHSSSFFFGTLAKLLYPKVKLFWHDHHGNRIKSHQKNHLIRLCSFFFSGVFTVNEEVLAWAQSNLFCKECSFLPNFTTATAIETKTTFLKGEAGKRMVCLSNLRNPKNHAMIVEAFADSSLAGQGWTMHFIGKDNQDQYSDQVKESIRQYNLQDAVHLYGSCDDVYHILSQAAIGLLASTFEGFPVALLEYGNAGLAVISTNVGYCASIITDNESGLLFSPTEKEELTQKMVTLAQNPMLRTTFGTVLKQKIDSDYSEKAVLSLLEKKYCSR
ncbi:glycosyltransferase [Flavobacterium pedocola]